MRKKYIIIIHRGFGVSSPLATYSPSVDKRTVYLKTFDFEAYNGRGEIQTTASKKVAKKFNTMEQALAFCRTTSKTVPLRWDGKPNKPLTACTIEIVSMKVRTLTTKRKKR